MNIVFLCFINNRGHWLRGLQTIYSVSALNELFITEQQYLLLLLHMFLFVFLSLSLFSELAQAASNSAEDLWWDYDAAAREHESGIKHLEQEEKNMFILVEQQELICC